MIAGAEGGPVPLAVEPALDIHSGARVFALHPARAGMIGSAVIGGEAAEVLDVERRRRPARDRFEAAATVVPEGATRASAKS